MTPRSASNCTSSIRKLPVPTPEAVYVALPFQSPDGTHALRRPRAASSRPAKTQIPGSASDWQTIQSFLSVRNAAGQIIVGSEQAPLVQLGDFNLGKWMPVTSVDKPHVYSWVMNNYWFTNFRTEQEGEFKWHYYLTSGPDTSTATATRFGWGSRLPLASRVLPAARNGAAAKHPAAFSTLSIPAPNLLLVESRPALEGKGIVLHLREVDGKPATFSRRDLTSIARISRMDEVNVLEEPLKPKLNAVSFAPFEAKFIKLTIR